MGCLSQKPLILGDQAKRKALGEKRGGAGAVAEAQERTQPHPWYLECHKQKDGSCDAQAGRQKLPPWNPAHAAPPWVTERARAWSPGAGESTHSPRQPHVKQPSGCQCPPRPFLLGPGPHEGLRPKVPSGPGVALRSSSARSSSATARAAGTASARKAPRAL